MLFQRHWIHYPVWLRPQLLFSYLIRSCTSLLREDAPPAVRRLQHCGFSGVSWNAIAIAGRHGTCLSLIALLKAFSFNSMQVVSLS